MAFNRDGWNPIGGQSKKGTAPQVFSYTTADAVADVNTEGYFNSVWHIGIVTTYCCI
jgi:hypothetical protein